MRAIDTLKTSLMKAEKGLMERVARMVLQDPEQLEDLFQICISNEKVVSWRAAWVLNHLARKNKDFVKGMVPDMIRSFPYLKYDGQKACFLRSLSHFNLDDKNIGKVLDECLDFLQKETSRPFMISYALDFLQKICRQEPELAREVHLTISINKGHFPTEYLQKKAKRILLELETIFHHIS